MSTNEDENAMKWIYKGLGGKKGIEFVPNKTVKTHDEGPSPADVQLNAKLLGTLQEFGAYEDEESNQKREQALENIEKLMKIWACEVCKSKNVPVEYDCSCRVVPFGSYCLGVHSKDSDIDLLCIMPQSINRTEFFSRVPSKLAEVNGITCVKALADAFVPVIKFQYCGIDIDLGMVRMPCESIPPELNISLEKYLSKMEDTKDMTCLNGPRVTYELLRRVPNIANFKVLLRAIKLWARRREIYSNIVGFPGGVAWGIMAAKVAQVYPNMCPSVLLEKFFSLYKEWNFADPIIVVPPDECQAPSGTERYVLAWDPTRHHFSKRPLTVITPTYPMANATFNITDSALNVIRSEIFRASNLTQGISRGENSYSELFAPATFFKLYGNYVQVEVISSEKYLESFSGYVESQLRKLVERLTMSESGLYIAHPCTRHFGPVKAEPCAGEDAYEGPLQTILFYIGLKFDDALVKAMKESGRGVELTTPVMEFLSGIQRPDDKQTLVKIKVVKRRLLPEWVKQEYDSQWKCGVVQSADHGQREAVKKRTMGELANAASNGSMKRLKAET